MKKYALEKRREGIKFMKFIILVLFLFSTLIPLTDGKILPYFIIAYLLAFYVFFEKDAGLLMRILGVIYAGLMITLSTNLY